MRWNFAHILNKSLIRPISYENSLWSLSNLSRSSIRYLPELEESDELGLYQRLSH